MNILEEIQNCPIEWKELGEVCEVKAGKNINKTFIQNNLGNFPVINSGKEPLGYINIFNTQNDPIGITSRGAGVGYVSWNEGEYFRGNLNYSATVQNEEVLLPRFLYFYLKNSSKEIENLCTFDGIPALNKSALEGLLIPIPPLEIQEKIVKTLDKFTDYVTELTSELTSRKKQYSFYRDKLLSFEDEVYQVDWKVLKDVATLKNGKDWKVLPRGEIPVYGSGGEMGEFVADYSYDKPTVLIPRKGSISNLFYLEKAFWNVDTIYYTEIDDKQIIPKYFYYYLTTVKLEEMATNPTRPSLTQAILDKIRIPVPSLEIQSRIVQVLDNFDSVCNDLKIGLPKEIELRQKQYEYFREKLLTFVAEGEYTDSTVQTRHH